MSQVFVRISPPHQRHLQWNHDGPHLQCNWQSALLVFSHVQVWPNLIYNDVFAHLELSIRKNWMQNYEYISRKKKSSSHILEGQILCTNLEQKEYCMGMIGSRSLCLLSYYTLAEPWELVLHSGDISPSLRRKKKKEREKWKKIRHCSTQNPVHQPVHPLAHSGEEKCKWQESKITGSDIAEIRAY